MFIVLVYTYITCNNCPFPISHMSPPLTSHTALTNSSKANHHPCRQSDGTIRHMRIIFFHVPCSHHPCPQTPTRKDKGQAHHLLVLSKAHPSRMYLGTLRTRTPYLTPQECPEVPQPTLATSPRKSQPPTSSSGPQRKPHLETASAPHTPSP